MASLNAVKLKEGWCSMGLMSMGALGVAVPKIKEKLGHDSQVIELNTPISL